jgi:hypothetical protein
MCGTLDVRPTALLLVLRAATFVGGFALFIRNVGPKDIGQDLVGASPANLTRALNG